MTTQRKKFLLIAGVINKARTIQGWNLLSPKDTEPLASAWIGQLDRKNVSPQLYDSLLDMAVDRRVKAIRDGENPPPLTVELLLACYEKYRVEKMRERDGLRYRLDRIAVSPEVPAETVARYQEAYDSFLEKAFLNG